MQQFEIPDFGETRQSATWLKPLTTKTLVFWISEIRILRQLSTHGDDEIRKIPLQKGINIVWSPPGEVGGDERQRGRGHAAGKTSFCRAVRYILGEKHYGNKFISAKIADSVGLARAYVVAQVWIGDIPWAVARPLYQGGRHFSIPNTTLDEALAAEPSSRFTHEDFVTALNEAVLSGWEIRHFDTKGEQAIKWMHVLQALARDQESHLSSLHNWRSPQSAHDCPDMGDSERPFLMRCLMGLADERENKQLQNRAKQLALQKTEELNTQFYTRIFNESLTELKESMPDLSSDVSPLEDLFVEQVKKIATSEALKKAKDINDKIAKLGLAELKSRREEQLAKIAQIKGRIEEREETLMDLQSKLQAHQSKVSPTAKDTEELRSELIKSLRRGHHCGVPIPVAVAECQVYWRLGIGKDQQPSPVEDYSEGVVARFKAEIEKLGQELKPHRDEIKTSEAAKTELEAKIRQEEKIETALNGQLQVILAEPGEKSRLALNIAQALKKRAVANAAIVEAEKSAANSDKLLEEIRQDSAQAQERLSSIFNAVVKNVAGDHMSGELRFTKIENNAALFREGEVVSEAFNALKSLAYDFTALVASLNGIGHHPGFILHDSPRESDMEPSLYQPYFNFVSRLATNSSGSFQYIVTTTEPPPASLQTTPPICLTLDGSNGGDALYREIL